MVEIKSKYLGDDILEISLEKIELLLRADYNVSKRAIGLLLLQEDEEISKADPHTNLSRSYARDTALNSIKDVDVILLIEMDHNAMEPEVVIAWLQEALQKHYTTVVN